MSEAKSGGGQAGRWRFPYCWPSGYGPIEGLLMVLFFVLFVLPLAFLALWAETRSVRSAWRILWDLEPA